MATEFKLPEVAEGVDSADVAEIHVHEGDVIQANQVVMEVETDKAVAEIPCPHAGRVAKIHVKSGDSVSVGQVLLTIEEDAGAESKEAPPEKEAPQAESRTDKDEADAAPRRDKPEEPAQPGDVPADLSPELQGEGAGTERRPGEPSPTKQAEKSAPPQQTGGEGTEEWEVDHPQVASPTTLAAVRHEEDGDKRAPAPAAPSTRRLARQLGVDLRQIQGSGAGGRITVDDVYAHVRSITTTKPHDVSAPMGAPPLPDFTKYGEVRRERMSKLARVSAENLALSWRVVPHVTQHGLADVTELESARKNYMSTVGQSGPKVTMTAIMIKAVIASLREFPQFNASLDAGSGEIIFKSYYNIGIAVDTEYGLVVPVIRNADRKSILELAAELTALADKARDRKLSMEDMQGGTFTITNLGGIGGVSFTPIVNYPEVAILGMSRSFKQPQLKNGQLIERLMLPLSLSYDHRVINGADAARFIVKLTNDLSDFFHLLISR